MVSSCLHEVCICTAENEKKISFIEGLEVRSGAPVTFGAVFTKARPTSTLARSILRAVCDCNDHKPEGVEYLPLITLKLPLGGYEGYVQRGGRLVIRELILGKCGKGRKLLTNLVTQALTITDNLLTPLIVYKSNSRKPIVAESIAPSLAGTVMYWLFLLANGTWVKEMKYHLNWMFVDAEMRTGEDRLEYPERDNVILGKDGKIAIGTIQKLYNILLRTKVNRERNRSFRVTVLQGIKRGMPTVDLQFVIDSAIKHKAVLSQKKNTPEGILDYMENEVVKIIPEFLEDFGGVGSKLSHNSCSEKTLKELGPLAWCYEEFYESNHDQELTGKIKNKSSIPPRGIASLALDMSLASDNLLRMYYQPHVGVLEDRFRFDNGTVKKACHIKSMLSRSLAEPQGFVQEKTYVKFILEPLKCRTITKAPAFVNGIYKELQAHMWKSLQRRWQFSLIGEPVNIEHIKELEARTFEAMPGGRTFEDFYWVSGDYSAATDNMHMDVTYRLLRAVARQNLDWRHVMKRALVGNLISYKDCFKGMSSSDEPDDFLQTNGQLMGCIFSFIFLCVANYLLYKYTLGQVYGRDSRIYKECPVKINGDDILFKAEPKFIEQWTKNIALIGFKKSVGKNFEAKNFCTINSVYFLPDQNRSVPYLNHGFIYDMKKGVDSEMIGTDESRNSKLYLLGFADYIQYWDPNHHAEIRKNALNILLEHRKDIGWSGRSFFDLGLSSIDDDSVPMKRFRDAIAKEKAPGRSGLTMETQSSNAIYGLLTKQTFTDIRALRRQMIKENMSLLQYSRRRLIQFQENQIVERAIKGTCPIICQGQFYRARILKGRSDDNACKSLRSFAVVTG